MSPDGKLLAVLGDSADCLIADAQSGNVSLMINDLVCILQLLMCCWIQLSKFSFLNMI